MTSANKAACPSRPASGEAEASSPVEGLRLAIVGTRGIPASYGGFETFAERIAPLLAERHGMRVTVIGDATMRVADESARPVGLVRSRFEKSRNPLRFYWDSLALARTRADIALVCGSPGGALAFRARKDLVVATNPDGIESRRGKWSRPVQWLFAGTERASAVFSDVLVCDSPGIERYYRERHRARETFVVEYGAVPNRFLGERAGELADVLEAEGLRPGAYHLVVARLEPENNIHLIVDAYRRARGRLRHPLYVLSNRPDTDYARGLLASPPDGVVFYGSVFDKERLDALRAGARSYLHGHTVGGTNPSLVEAMASGNLCLCHDNEFNRETTGGAALFFRDAASLEAHLITAEEASTENEALRSAAREGWRERFTWELIADKYATLFAGLARRRRRA